MILSIIFALVITVIFVTFIYYTFRPEGLIENLLAARDLKCQEAVEAAEKAKKDIVDVANALAMLGGDFEAFKTSATNRMISFESRVGRAAKRNEKELMDEQLRKEIQHIQQNNRT
jgi:cbb3-type cytochrome oxidase subunit 3